MRERPILFSAPMVRAILDGTKTQTRWVTKPQPGYPDGGEWVGGMHEGAFYFGPPIKGDPQNWVLDNYTPCPYGLVGDRLWVRERGPSHEECGRSRITLEITGVRVERVQEISEADAQAEGIEKCDGGWKDYSDRAFVEYGLDHARSSYCTLWESINGSGSWNANPWVWVIEFKRVMP